MKTTYGDISPRTAAFVVRKLLARGQPLLHLERFGMIDPQGQNKTDSRKYRKYNALALATAPLAEGVTPAGQKLTASDITCTLEQYGDYVTITDKVADMHEDPVLDEAVKLCSEQIAQGTEVIRYNTLKAGTNVFYANNVAGRSTVTSPATRGDFRRIKRNLKKYRAKEIAEIIKAGPDVSTEPVASAYFAVAHTDCEADLLNLSGFTTVEKYADSSKALPGEVGKLEGFRFILSDLFDPWLTSGASNSAMLPASTNCDVYPILIFGKDAYAIVPLQGKNAVTPAVHNPTAAVGDELGQKGFVSWKRYDGCVILQQTWMARLEVAATANPS